MGKHNEKSVELYGYMNMLSARIMHTQYQLLFDKALDNITVKDINIVKILGAKGSCKMSELSEMLNVADSTLTGLVDNLVKRHYLNRFRSDDDRRVVRVTLSDKGVEMFKTIDERSLEIYDHIMDTLDEKEQDTLIKLFKKIAENFV